MKQLTGDERFVVVIEDDFEIAGNGSGNVAALQYLPADGLMRIAETLDIPVTFMVDVAQQLAFRRAAGDNPAVAAEAAIWDESVRLMARRGFDIQLHLHPQWAAAKYEDGRFHVGGEWNLGRLADADQHALVHEALDYLHRLLASQVAPIVAFKAGAWGLQPWDSLHNVLRDAGVRIVIGVRDGLRIRSLGVDYRHIESPVLPYWVSRTDVTKVGPDPADMIVVPLQPVASTWPDIAWLGLDRAMSWVRTPPALPLRRAPTGLPKAHADDRLRLRPHPYLTHLKIGNQPARYLIRTFERTIGGLRATSARGVVPIVIESHTKQMGGHLPAVASFLKHLTARYSGEVGFTNVTGLARLLEDGALAVLPVRESA